MYYRISFPVGCATFVLLALPASVIAEDDKKLARAKDFSELSFHEFAKAFHNYASANEDMRLPHDITDRNGKPLLSWRVAILPFLELPDLYNEFNRKEPWDSEHNKKLIERMPQIYAAPRGADLKGQTCYQSFAGTAALMNGKTVPIDAIPDGLKNTFMVVEAGEAVIWTKPADIPFDPKKPLPKLGGVYDGDFHVAFCDGDVCYIKKGVNEETLKKFITIAGNEKVRRKDLVPEK